MRATPTQQKSCQKQIGNDLKVRLPDGQIIPAWQLLEASLRSSGPGADYLPKETARISVLYEKHAPEVPARYRLRRALRMALRLVAFDVLGTDGDAADLRVLALANGLTVGEFEIVSGDTGPLLSVNSDALRKLGSKPGDSAAIH